MRVKATWHHVIAVTREVEVDEADFKAWAARRYGGLPDTDLALAAYIEHEGTDLGQTVFHDWRTNEPLPSDFELQYSDVIDATTDMTGD